MISVKNLHKSFKDREIFNDLSMELPSKGMVGILGESGSGKTTFLNLISGLDQNYTGKIEIDRRNIKDFSSKEIGAYRLKNVGFVFQNFNLLNLDTVSQNVRLSLESISNKPQYLLNKRVNDVLRIVGLTEKKNERVNNLSGGQKQRAAIARALINNPKIILCDEPTGALDNENAKEIMELLYKISRHSLVIISTHDAERIKVYADTIFQLKNKTFVEISNKKSRISVKNPLIRDVGKTTNKPNLPLLFKFRHSFQKMKVKKYRTLITNIMISLSLTSIGLSLVLSSSLNTKLESAFSSLFTSSQIIMTPKQSNPNIFDGIYSASRSQVEEIANRYNYYIDGVGATYMVNFEDFFKDNNELYISSTAYKIPLSSFSARSINDFRWIDDNVLTMVYPGLDTLDNDEIVLGLKYEDMANICYKLHIQRNYRTLGEYIKNKTIQITFSVANNDWMYDDEQLFRLAGVVETTSPVIYHTNRLWNEYMFEEQMRFPSGDGSFTKLPWVMYKLYYLTAKDDPTKFLNAALYDNDLYDYSFERTNYKYHPTLCKPGGGCQENRLLVYYVDKNSIHMRDVMLVNKYFPELSNYYMNTNYGYVSYGAAMMSGFARNAFLSVNEDMLDEAMDAEATMHQETPVALDLKTGIIQGNFTNSVNGGLQFSTNITELSSGKMPENDLEIIVSSGLASYLGIVGSPINMRLHFGAISNEYYEKDILYKEYSKATLKIVGVIESKEHLIYQKPNWSVSFFRDQLGISSFNLTPTGVVFELADLKSSEKTIERLNKMFPSYDFVDPIRDAIDSVDQTTSYMKVILLVFSLITMVISIILLSLTILINVAESYEEIRLFGLMGYSQFDIYSMFVCHSLLQGFVSFLLSSVELTAIDYLINVLLSKTINSSIGFSVNFRAVLIEFLLMLAIVVTTSLAVSISLVIKNKRSQKLNL